MLIDCFSIDFMFFAAVDWWEDTRIDPGHDWRKALKGALDTAFDAAKPAIEEIA